MFIICGQGNGVNNLGIEFLVVVYIDGVFCSCVGMVLFDFMGIECVEVLCGL